LGEGAVFGKGRFLKVLITRRLRKKDGCLGRDVLEGVEGGVTDQSGPRADLGADFLPSVSSSLVFAVQVSRCFAVAWSALVLVLVWSKGNYQV
jgi:hypothetical protein